MYCHARSKSCHFFRKFFSRTRSQPIYPLVQFAFCGIEQSLNLLARESLRQRQWRESRLEENLIRISIPDPTEHRGSVRARFKVWFAD